MSSLELFLFGPPRVELDSAPVEFQRRKALALLIYLSVSAQPHSRDALATLFYPDHSQQRARAYLRRDLAVVNTSLLGEWLDADREIVELRSDGLWLDVAEFQRLLAGCQSHTHSPEVVCPNCLNLLAEAVSLYPADFLAGFTLRDCPEFDDWQFFQAESLRQDLTSALERLTRGLSEQDDYAAAIPHARRRLALDALHEPAQQMLMQLYAQAGQQAAALRQYEEYARLLDEELGVSPEEETTKLYEAIKAKRVLGAYLKTQSPLREQAEAKKMGDSSAPPITPQAPQIPKLEQQVRFCTSLDGVRIAYATVGEGPVLVKAANWLSHLEYDWNSPVWQHWLTSLAKRHTLVRYDERGCGLSDWEVEEFSIETFVKDLETVVNTLGLDRFPLLGVSQGGPVAIAYAVRHPEKVSHLILYGAYARGRFYRDYSPEQIELGHTFINLVKLGWGKDNPAFRQFFTSLFMPEATPDLMDQFNELQRVSSSPDNAAKLREAFFRINVSDLAPQVIASTLILHARDDSIVPYEEGRQLAALIPNARFVSLESKNHILLENEPAWQRFLAEINSFVS